MSKEKGSTRRSVLKKAGGALLAIPVADSAAARDESADSKGNDEERDDESREVLYADEDVRLVKYDEQQYVVEGDYTPERYRELMAEYVWSDDDEMSTQTHDDEGTDSSTENVTVNGTEYNLYTYSKSWSQADNGYLTWEGKATASSYNKNWYSYPVDKIYISTTLRGNYRKSIVNIAAAPSYTVNYDSGEATLDGSRTDTSSYSLYHYEDAVTMECQDCWYDSAQDDKMWFKIDDEDHWLGNYVGLDVGHCWT